MSRKQIASDEPDIEAVKADAREQALTGEYRIGEGSIFHMAHGKTFWKVRCNAPVPGIGEVPALTIEAPTEAEAIQRYAADQKIPDEMLTYCYALPKRVPSIAPGTVATLQSPIKLPE